MSINNDNFGSTIAQDKIVEDVAKMYGVAVPKEVPVSEFLGVCPACDADVFADKPHVEVTTVFVFEDKTARTNSDYLHMNCYKFGGN